MTLRLHQGEPLAGPWRVQSLAFFLRILLESAGSVDGRPTAVAIDGRSGSGKTTLAERLCRAVPGAEVVHTDDVAWEHSRFGWDDLMVAGVLDPLRRGRSVRYRPPAWERGGRTGFISVSAAAPLLIVEGVGASRRELARLVDASVWLQSDWAEAERRGLIGSGGSASAVEGWHAWQTEELPFLAADRPWERARVIIAGAPEVQYDEENEVVLAERTWG